MKILKWLKNILKKKEISHNKRDIYRNKKGEVFCDGEPMRIYRYNTPEKPWIMGCIDVLNDNKPYLSYIVPWDWDINTLPLKEKPHG